LQIQIAVRATVLNRQYVIDVGVTALNDNAADPTRVRITHEDPQPSRGPVCGAIVRRFFGRLGVRSRWFPSTDSVWHGVTF
jgi:hypothetical protein